jgi:hypothetical protein
MWCSRRQASLGVRPGSMYATPQPNFQTSTSSPTAASTALVASRVSPLSSTWVSPTARGLLPRRGNERKDRLTLSML